MRFGHAGDTLLLARCEMTYRIELRAGPAMVIVAIGRIAAIMVVIEPDVRLVNVVVVVVVVTVVC